jgi:hypothetical protein
MAYHDELLQLASELINKADATQAELRRAASTAYYAVFHLLIAETILNWKRESSRNALGRMFDHGQMRKICAKVADPKVTPFAGEDPSIVDGLRFVANAFVELQSQRRIADYDNGVIWTQLDAGVPIAIARTAFLAWDDIKHTDIAQEYLVSLLIRTRD